MRVGGIRERAKGKRARVKEEVGGERSITSDIYAMKTIYRSMESNKSAIVVGTLSDASTIQRGKNEMQE